MCTDSWLYQQNGYQLFFNRDELKTRKPALPPKLKQRAGVGILTPEDGDAGGTWIAVNEFGLTVCLLNYYDRPYELMAGESFTSRGLLVLALAEQRDVTSAQLYLNTHSMRNYRACHVLMLDPSACASATWNGETIEHNNAPLCPMSSSSFETRFVITGRQSQFKAQFADVAPTAEGLFAFQKTHLPEKGPFSVCMHRAEAGTVSHSQINVSGDAASFAYIDGAPCEGQFLPPISLPLRKLE
jgi:hypothetical protein